MAIYPDIFDEIVIISRKNNGGVDPSYTSVRWDVLGIGLDNALFDNSAAYGSSGILHGVINESALDVLMLTFSHEFMHQFCCFLSNPSLDLTRGNGLHFLALATDSGGLLGNNQYMVEQSSGDFVIVPRSEGKYSAWELNVAGLISDTQTPPVYAVLTPAVNEYIGSVIPRSATTLITIGNIRAIYGSRSPSYDVSQKRFQVLFVVLSETTAPPAVMALYNTAAKFYESGAPCEINRNVFPPLPCSFSAATNGNGTLETAVPLPK